MKSKMSAGLLKAGQILTSVGRVFFGSGQYAVLIGSLCDSHKIFRNAIMKEQ